MLLLHCNVTSPYATAGHDSGNISSNKSCSNDSSAKSNLAVGVAVLPALLLALQKGEATTIKEEAFPLILLITVCVRLFLSYVMSRPLSKKKQQKKRFCFLSIDWLRQRTEEAMMRGQQTWE